MVSTGVFLASTLMHSRSNHSRLRSSINYLFSSASVSLSRSLMSPLLPNTRLALHAHKTVCFLPPDQLGDS